MELETQGQPGEVTFTLAPSLRVESIQLLSRGKGESSQIERDVPFECKILPEPSTQQVVVTLPKHMVGRITLLWSYRGVIDDPPKEPRHLRFVTPSETSGHIGPEGVYLSSESQWYPDIEGSLARFAVNAAVPPEWTVVTQGRKLEERKAEGKSISTWAVREPTEALTLVANKFVGKHRNWSGSRRQNVELSTYFLPGNAALADEYLDATAKYLDVYTDLLGDYPFDKFAVVENFFASGLGMPSFTLLGSGIIKRHYVQPYALGHEIVHSWIGNAVFNRIDRGNWVEGLTTYLSNYYWHEQAGDQRQARDQRRMMFRGYNLHVPMERDYPVSQFSRKKDERDNAIGYQKAAMVFHLLRQEIGEDAFWTALKRLVAQYRGRHAEWSDLEQVFAEAAGRDLRWFFAQWIEAPGAPELSLHAASATPISDGGDQAFRLVATIVQTGRAFRLTVPLTVKLIDGHEQIVHVPVDRERNVVDVTLPARPVSIELDSETMILQRVPRGSLPPVLNHFVTDQHRSVVLAFSDPPNGTLHPFRGIVKRIESQDSQKPETDRASIESIGGNGLLPREGSVLVLASPEWKAALRTIVSAHCGDHLEFHEGGVRLNGSTYEGSDLVLLVSCHRTDRPGSVVTLLYAESPEAATVVSRLLFFYGWNSYVVFKNGSPVARGEWATAQDQMEVEIHGSEAIR
ncbi:M1 family metallopeptidase [Petrachloros mirabilis]